MSMQGLMRALRLASVLLLAMVLGVVFAKGYREFTRARALGRLAGSVVSGQQEALTRAEYSFLGALEKTRDWTPDSDASALLQSWMISQTARRFPPEQILMRMKAMAGRARFSDEMRVSLERWGDALSRWSISRQENLSIEERLREGRARYFEAAGYQRMGRGFDATVLYLWSVDLLLPVIQQDVPEQLLAEALYLVGASYFHLRKAFPPGVRGDRLLNLCLEIYPESVWANQANILWQNGMMSNGA